MLPSALEKQFNDFYRAAYAAGELKGLLEPLPATQPAGGCCHD